MQLVTPDYGLLIWIGISLVLLGVAVFLVIKFAVKAALPKPQEQDSVENAMKSVTGKKN